MFACRFIGSGTSKQTAADEDVSPQQFEACAKMLKLKTLYQKKPICYFYNAFRRALPDIVFTKNLYKKSFGRELNLDTPRSFNEKIQWLKLYDRKPLYTSLADKYTCKKFIAERIGEEYVIPVLGKWNRFKDIDFDALPNQFILKCNHDSGSIIICKDKKSFDYAAAKKRFNRSLRKNFYWSTREWQYKNISPCIFAEEYKEDSLTHELRDYKFFCFDGCVRALYIATNRQSENRETTFDFFDSDFNHLPFSNLHPNATSTPEKPKSFEKMKELASILSRGFPLLRVDFYEADGKPYVGELTFYHNNGMTRFCPDEWDYIFGEWITLPGKSR